jgi:hypothetical protein
MTRTIFIAAALALAVTLPAVPANAQAPRTFVSAAGTDNPTCSFAAPCRHFQAAADATSAGGEVDALDPAGYGPINIDRPITIEGQGWSYIAPPASGNGITINAVSGKVTIRGVSLNGVGISGITRGILFNSGTSLNVQNCIIENFSGYGILFQPTAASKISVSNTVASDNNFGIYIGPTGGATTIGVLDHVHIENSINDGLTLIGTQQNIVATITESVIADNGGDGITATGTSFAVAVIATVRNSSVVSNGRNGVETSGVAVIELTRSSIMYNASAEYAQGANGIVGTFNDNTFNGGGTGSLTSFSYR